MIKVHLKQGGSVIVPSDKKGEWKIKYHGFVRLLQVSKSSVELDTPDRVSKKYFSIPMENVLFIEEILN